MAGAGRDQVHNIEQQVPKFIREFREKTGQAAKDVPNIDSKRQQPVRPPSDGEDEDRPEETPIVCVGKGVSEEEALTFTKDKFGDEAVEKSALKRKHEDEDDGSGGGGVNDTEANGKLMFKKPTKEWDTSKDSKKKKDKSSKSSSKGPKVQNKTLLSFGDEEEEEEGT